MRGCFLFIAGGICAVLGFAQIAGIIHWRGSIWIMLCLILLLILYWTLQGAGLMAEKITKANRPAMKYYDDLFAIKGRDKYETNELQNIYERTHKKPPLYSTQGKLPKEQRGSSSWAWGMAGFILVVVLSLLIGK